MTTPQAGSSGCCGGQGLCGSATASCSGESTSHYVSTQRHGAPRATIREMRIAVSYYCNLRCQHCYVPETSRFAYKRLIEPHQLSIDELETFIDMLAEECGTKSISITGGEALLAVVWPRTERVMQRALNHGLKTRLITAGSGQVDVETVLRSARRSDNLLLQVSLDGITPDLVDGFRGKAGAWQHAVDTIRTIAAAGTSVLVRYTVTDDNFDQTIGCYDLVAELGASSFVVKPMFSTGTARQHKELLVTPESVAALQQQLVARSVGRRTKLKLPQPCYVAESDLPAGANVEVMYCGCGRDVAYLAPNGDIFPCTYIAGMPGLERWRLGNLRDAEFDLHSAWTASNTYREFRDAPTHCHCTAQHLANQVDDDMFACRH